MADIIDIKQMQREALNYEVELCDYRYNLYQVIDSYGNYFLCKVYNVMHAGNLYFVNCNCEEYEMHSETLSGSLCSHGAAALRYNIEIVHRHASFWDSKDDAKRQKRRILRTNNYINSERVYITIRKDISRSVNVQAK